VLEKELWKPKEWRRHRLSWGPTGVTLVAEVDGTVVGILTCERGFRAVTRHNGEFGITISASARGISVGRAMLKTLEIWAREHGVTRIALGVFPHNERARALYRSLGYEEEGVERAGMNFPEGEQDVIRMSKRVPAHEVRGSDGRGYDEAGRSRDGGDGGQLDG
jgi:RimJ/RimL family protein N-acetyltransferase